MAIYHFSAKVISRATGRSAVAAAAYRSASELHDERLGRSHDYSDKTGVVHSEVLLPGGAPGRLSDRTTLWNEVEAGEKRKDAQLAREVEFSIPREMSQADGVALARDFVQREFVDRGMVADLNVHWDFASDGAPKPHAHVMLAMREVGPDGFGKKVREWNATSELTGWRERWAEHANERLASLGIDASIDHRSFKDQGVNLEPQHKIGPAGQRRAKRGEDAERAADHVRIARDNGAKIIAEPGIALDAITRQQSTFTTRDLAMFVHRHSDGKEQFDQAMGAVRSAPEFVALGTDGRGRERFTSRDMLDTEARLERAGDELANGRGHGVADRHREAAIGAAEGRGLALSGEQADALHHVTSDGDLALVVGYAGTGKSAMLGVAREAWEREGYTVRGAALSGIAAENLEAGSGIQSRTLASYEHAWGRDRDELTGRDVLVVDEAGMVGSRQMERVLSHARAAGAKVVLVGDPEQLQAIEAGAAFRALAERHGAAEITQVRRQRDEWQRDATRELATGRTSEALDRYADAGMVQGHATCQEAKAALVEGWAAERNASPGKSQVILAHTRADVAELNGLARVRLRDAGELGHDQAVQTGRGERAFAAGDRLMFLKNERSMDVKNGTLGTVEHIEGDRLSVRLDGAERRSVAFDVKDYADVDHGYAATIHKAQGVTVDRAHVLATPTMDRHMAYVGLTRHRDSVALHYGTDDFARGQVDVARVLGRERPKDTTLDYAQGFAERRGIIPARDGIEVPARAQERARAPFAGLRLGREVADRQTDQQVGAPSKGRFAGLKLGRRDQAEAPQRGTGDRLEQAVSGYAEAWRDAQRMTARRLPVLPHQAQELDRAGKALDAQRPHGAADLAAAFKRTPGLDQAIGRGEAGRGVEAMNAAGRARAEGKDRDIAKEIGLPPRTRDRGMER